VGDRQVFPQALGAIAAQGMARRVGAPRMALEAMRPRHLEPQRNAFDLTTPREVLGYREDSLRVPPDTSLLRCRFITLLHLVTARRVDALNRALEVMLLCATSRRSDTRSSPSRSERCLDTGRNRSGLPLDTSLLRCRFAALMRSCFLA